MFFGEKEIMGKIFRCLLNPGRTFFAGVAFFILTFWGCGTTMNLLMAQDETIFDYIPEKTDFSMLLHTDRFF